MTGDLIPFENVRNYLTANLWFQHQSGIAGALWEKQSAEQTWRIAVPTILLRDSIEWRSIIERLSIVESRPIEAVAFRLENPFVDVARFRAAKDYIIRESIPLTAGVGLVGAAYRLLRASATTARRPRAHIAGGFSKTGDEIVSRARAAQTERGSYVLPVLIPLTKPESPMILGADQNDISRIALEPDERRVTRTLAEALNAIQKYIVEPAVSPRASDMPLLVQAGASRELVLAIGEILKEEAVATFEASFDWAAAITKPAILSSKVEIPSEAGELMTFAAGLLRTSTREPSQSISGPIVEVRHEPNDPYGEIALQTFRRGRQVEVRIRVQGDVLDSAYGWMQTSRTIVVNGRIQKVPGRQLRIDTPTGVSPLDEGYIPSVDS